MMAFYTYKYTVYPTKKQSILIEDSIKLCSFLRNEYKKDLAENHQFPALAKDILNLYIEKYPLLQSVSKMLLIGEIFRINEGRTQNSFSFSYTSYLIKNYPIKDDKFYIPNIGWVKKGNYRKITNKEAIKYFTVMKRSNHYYLLIILFIPDEKKALNGSSVIGFDYSSTHFLVDNFGNRYDIPRFQKDVIVKIKNKMKRLKKCKKGSNTYVKLKKEISNTYIYSKNKRLDYLHKISSTIINNYDCIVIEDLCMRKIAGSFNLYDATYDNSFYKFTEMLKYKAKAKGKKLIKVNRYFPSTKMCNICGSINKNLTIKDRTWKCPNCGSLLDRDINSAINIKNEGLRLIAGGQPACYKQNVL